jgi:hypothetical protein
MMNGRQIAKSMRLQGTPERDVSRWLQDETRRMQAVGLTEAQILFDLYEYVIPQYPLGNSHAHD